MKYRYYIIIPCLFAFYTKSLAQQVELPLKDMSAFQSQAGNWMVVKDVTMDPAVDIHHQEEEETRKKQKKKARSQPEAVTYEPGTGILLNLPEEGKKDNLITAWEHGDIELELEVMLPKGSNSGIYLQGRYELQLFDSWGVKDPKFSDIGGIYRNWQTDPELSYMGKAPLVNAAKAPGLWQKLKIGFRAPRFDAAGNKTVNARLDYVDLNGVRIHENVEIPKLTGGAIAPDEAATGPLMIQGDHGAVAIRNIQYRLMKDPNIELTDLSYEFYRGEFRTAEEMLSNQPERSGSLEKLTYEASNVDNNFGIRYTGELNIAEAGEYTFSSSSGGMILLQVNNQEVLNGWRDPSGTIHLEQGSHQFQLIYLKSTVWLEPRLGIWIKGASTYPKALHAFNSAPPGSELVSPIYVDPEEKPKLLRAFLDYKGDRANRLTHTIGVGEPTKIHYIYNMKAGNVACVWKGDFVNATPMWHDRGDGSFVPRGMIQYLSDRPSVAVLSDPLDAFPENTTDEAFRSKGYKLDESGRPVFSYTYMGIAVKDQVYPDETSAKFIREVTFSETPENTYFMLAEGSDIQELTGRRFLVGDKAYLITLVSDAEPVVRQVEGAKQLLIPVQNKQLIYSITW